MVSLRTILLCFLFSLLTAPALADEIYMEVDENGVPVFSDTRVSDDSEPVQLREPTTYSEPTNKPMSQRELDKLREIEEKAKAPPKYKLKITSPENDSAIRDNAGNLSVTVSISPKLLITHKAQLLLDGAEVKSLRGSGTVELTEVDRGTHTLKVQITDLDGKVIASSKPVQVTLHRFSRLHSP